VRSLDVLRDLAQSNAGLVTRRQALGAGLRDDHLAYLVKRGAIARIARGVYAIGAPIPDALAISASWHAAISFESAVAWLGMDLPAPVDRLHVTVPRRRGRYAEKVPGIRLHRADVAPWDIAIVRGARVTKPLRTAMDICRHAPVDQGVAVVDALLRARAFSIGELLSAAQMSKGPGRLRIQVAASLADPDSGSILESLARVLMWRDGLPTPQTQLSIRGSRGWIGRVDFAWPDHKVLLECDGYEFHAARDRFQADRRRWSALAAAGWQLVVVTWFDVTRDPAYVLATMREALGLPLKQNTNVARVAS
jgi:hypothetical protein